jgi:hypothetical protein
MITTSSDGDFLPYDFVPSGHACLVGVVPCVGNRAESQGHNSALNAAKQSHRLLKPANTVEQRSDLILQHPQTMTEYLVTGQDLRRVYLLWENTCVIQEVAVRGS